MEHLQDMWQGWPCHLATHVERGRYLVASQFIPAGQVVLLSEAYLTALLPSYKKRVCQYCLCFHPKRLSTSCRDCNQCWYCSTACQQAHLSGLPQDTSALSVPTTAHTAHLVPHRLTCAVLKRFASIKCDPAMESVIRMLLDAMALQRLEAHSDASGSPANQDAAVDPSAVVSQDVLAQHTSRSTQAQLQPGSATEQQQQRQQQQRQQQQQKATQARLPRLHHRHLMLLQSHAADFADKDRKDWLVNLRFLRNAMEQLDWPGVWSEQALLDMVGRIASNNFGIYRVKQGQARGMAVNCKHEEQQEDKPADSGVHGQQCLVQQQQQQQHPGLSSDKSAQQESGHAQVHAARESALPDMHLKTRDHRQQQQPQHLVALPATYCLNDPGTSEADDCYTSMQKPLLLWPMQASMTNASQQHIMQDGSCNIDMHPKTTCVTPMLQVPASMHLHGQGLQHSPDAETINNLAGHIAEASIGNEPCYSSSTAEKQDQSAVVQHSGTCHQQQAVHAACTCDALVNTKDQATIQLPVYTAANGNTDCSKAMLEHFASQSLEQDQVTAPGNDLLGKEDVIGREMYITASFFNHSCDPNCVKTRGHGNAQGTAVVTATRDVEAGEALTISYIDLELPRSARQLELKTSFFFDCKCSRCESELTQGSKKCSYTHKTTQQQSQAPKRRGRKARVSR